MKTRKDEQFDELTMDESDEYLIKMTEALKLELRDVKVSNELIKRTLAKVHEQAKNEEQTMAPSSVVPIESMKVSTKYKNRNYHWIKSVSVAAAACFVLILGVNAMKNGGMNGSKGDMLLKSTESSSDSSSYKTKTSDQFTNATTSAGVQEEIIPSSEIQEEPIEGGAPSNIESNYQLKDDLMGSSNEKEDNFGDAGGTGISENDNVMASSNKVYNKALESIPSEITKVYQFPESVATNQAVSLLTLLTSKELRISASEPTDEWDYYLVFSLGEEDAVTYQVGKKFVIATSYHNEEEPRQLVYEMMDAKNFRAELLEYLN